MTVEPPEDEPETIRRTYRDVGERAVREGWIATALNGLEQSLGHLRQSMRERHTENCQRFAQIAEDLGGLKSNIASIKQLLSFEDGKAEGIAEIARIERETLQRLTTAVEKMELENQARFGRGSAGASIARGIREWFSVAVALAAMGIAAFTSFFNNHK